LATRAKKAHIGQVPYPGKLSVPTLQTYIGKAYKQFGLLKKEDNWWDTWIAQLIEAQSSAWHLKKRHYGNNSAAQKGSVRQLQMYIKHCIKRSSINLC